MQKCMPKEFTGGAVREFYSAYISVFFMLGCVLLFLSACPSIPSATATPLPHAVDLRTALEQSSRHIAESLDSGASIAIISVTAADVFEGEYALEEMTLLLVRTQKFRIVDRQNLDSIREEQQFQLSGEVDDETAVSIGRLTGAAFVISGSINQWESEKHLRFRALDVQSGEIRAMTSVAYGEDS